MARGLLRSVWWFGGTAGWWFARRGGKAGLVVVIGINYSPRPTDIFRQRETAKDGGSLRVSRLQRGFRRRRLFPNPISFPLKQGIAVSRLSVIIPVLGNLEQMEHTLLSVLENRPDDCEVIVVLDEPYDDPYHLEGEVRFLPPEGKRGLAAAVNRGLRAASNPLVHILACGCEVIEGWAEAAAGHFQDERIACVVPVVVQQEKPSAILAAGLGYEPTGRLVHFQYGVPIDGVLLAHRTQVLPHASGAIFRKDLLELIGGADPMVGDQWVMADLVLTLQHANRLSILEPRCRVRATHIVGVFPGEYRLACDAEAFFWRWNALAGSWTQALRHVGSLAGEGVASLVRWQRLPRLSGRLAGMRRPTGGEFLAQRIRRLRRAEESRAVRPFPARQPLAKAG